MKVSGLIHVFGDHVDTDVILPTHAIVNTDPQVLAQHCFSGIIPGFVDRVRPGDFIIAGENFGCGSSREHAPLAIKACGIGCIVAASFGRIFYRNAINLGLPVIECAGALAHAEQGAAAEVDLISSVLTVGGKRFSIPRYPPEVLQILNCGGLVPFMKARLQASAAAAAI
jgi:3-isopropylmalate/(R)-2-methylmalate dehydratase small subunit